MISLIRTGFKAYAAYRTVTTIKAKLSGKKPPTIWDDLRSIKNKVTNKK